MNLFNQHFMCLTKNFQKLRHRSNRNRIRFVCLYTDCLNKATQTTNFMHLGSVVLNTP